MRALDDREAGALAVEHALATLRLAPGDASALSAAASTLESSGDGEAAARLFAEAGRRDPLDWAAFDRRIRQAQDLGEVVRGQSLLDLALRRYPARSETLFPVLADLASMPGGRPLLVETLLADPAWRRPFLRWAIERQPDLALAVMGAVAARGGGLGPERNRLIDALVAGRRYREARDFGALTEEVAERAAPSPVRDPGFAQGFAPNVMGWRHFESAEAEMTAAGEGMRLRFRDRPAKLGNLRQVVTLPPGDYRFTVEASASGLRTPRPLVWTIACMDDWRELARIDVPPGSYASRCMEAAMQVPADCPAQQITLFTLQRAQDPQRAYSGSVTMHRVTVEPAGAS